MGRFVAKPVILLKLGGTANIAALADFITIWQSARRRGGRHLQPYEGYPPLQTIRHAGIEAHWAEFPRNPNARYRASLLSQARPNPYTRTQEFLCPMLYGGR
jgi:hypothetical protein